MRQAARDYAASSAAIHLDHASARYTDFAEVRCRHSGIFCTFVESKVCTVILQAECASSALRARACACRSQARTLPTERVAVPREAFTSLWDSWEQVDWEQVYVFLEEPVERTAPVQKPLPLAKLKVKVLKQRLEAAGLSSTGLKAVLVQRLAEHYSYEEDSEDDLFSDGESD